MIVELKKDLCEDKTIEFNWRCEESMCVRFSHFATHDEFVICVWKRNDSESRDESEKIFDVNKKYFERISKSSSNRANINHKESNTWSICHIARKIVRWRDDWSERIRETLESKNRESKNRESIVLVWSKAFIQRMLLFDRRISLDWMKIRRKDDEKDRKFFWDEFKN
jgi:hypothetical protein